MVQSTSIGFNRSGSKNEIAVAVKKFCDKKISETELLNIGKIVRNSNWDVQKNSGLDIVSSNDFSFLDNMLDMSCLVGNIQRRYYWEGGKIPIEIYFSMAYGQQKEKFDVLPLEVEHLLNTNYLYYVPEFQDPIEFTYSNNKPILEYLEAKNTHKIESRPIILGPISYLLLGKVKDQIQDPLSLLDQLLTVYEALFTNFKRVKITRVQIDEPLLCTELNRDVHAIYIQCYKKLAEYAGGEIKIDLTPYYGSIRDNFDLITSLPINSVHIDAFVDAEHIDEYVAKVVNTKLELSLGVVDGANIWINDIDHSVSFVRSVVNKLSSERVYITTSRPLLTCPYSIINETNIPPELVGLLSFSVEKLNELNLIKNVLNGSESLFKTELETNRQNIVKFKALQDRMLSIYKKDNLVHSKINEEIKFDYNTRVKEFSNKYQLGSLPTLTFGCLTNSEHKANTYKNKADVVAKLKESIAIQNNSNIDILSYAEFGQNDTHDFFASLLNGVYVLENSPVPYCGHEVHYPFIIYDEISVKDSSILSDIVKSVQVETKGNVAKPIKFSISGPVSFLNNSYLPITKKFLYRHIAEIIKEQINKLYAADIAMIQINEASILTDISFKISQSRVDLMNIIAILNYITTNLPSSLKVCLYVGYFNFNDTIEDIGRINCDLLLLESARSGHECLESFVSYKPSMQIGIGLFDPRDSRISTKNEINAAVNKIMMFFDEEQIFLTPDCAFVSKKDTQEVSKILDTMTAVAKDARKRFIKNNN